MKYKILRNKKDFDNKAVYINEIIFNYCVSGSFSNTLHSLPIPDSYPCVLLYDEKNTNYFVGYIYTDILNEFYYTHKLEKNKEKINGKLQEQKIHKK